LVSLNLPETLFLSRVLFSPRVVVEHHTHEDGLDDNEAAQYRISRNNNGTRRFCGDRASSSGQQKSQALSWLEIDGQSEADVEAYCENQRGNHEVENFPNHQTPSRPIVS
jgi:hypothetical protein